MQFLKSCSGLEEINSADFTITFKSILVKIINRIPCVVRNNSYSVLGVCKNDANKDYRYACENN